MAKAIEKDGDDEQTPMEDVEKHGEFASSLRDDMASLRNRISSMQSIDKISNKDAKEKWVASS
jgi:hypothetical protein